MSSSFEGYLLIADITGYTLYLTQSELEHAQEILTNLLELLIDHTRPPLVISRLAGDAVISYALAETFVQGQTFIEMIEDTYVAFRKAIEGMVLNNTCRCNACTNIANLDLKFFVHYGTFAIQHISDHDELVGSDVNLLHRLLKNHVTEVTGCKAYSLYTQPVIQQLGMEEFCQTMTAHVEAYEHLGEVQVWIQDMHPVWEQKRQALSLSLPPDRVLSKLEIEIALPPERVWDYLSHPEYRKSLMGSTRNEIHNRDKGRITSGSQYHCFHGDQIVPQTVMEWQPFERIVTKDRLPIPLMEVFILMEYRLEEAPGGTRLSVLTGKPSGPLPGRWMAERSILGMEAQGHEDTRAFKKRIESHNANHPEAPSGSIPISTQMVSQAAMSSLQETGE